MAYSTTSVIDHGQSFADDVLNRTIKTMEYMGSMRSDDKIESAPISRMITIPMNFDMPTYANSDEIQSGGDNDMTDIFDMAEMINQSVVVDHDHTSPRDTIRRAMDNTASLISSAVSKPGTTSLINSMLGINGENPIKRLSQDLVQMRKGSINQYERSQIDSLISASGIATNEHHVAIIRDAQRGIMASRSADPLAEAFSQALCELIDQVSPMPVASVMKPHVINLVKPHIRQLINKLA